MTSTPTVPVPIGHQHDPFVRTDLTSQATRWYQQQQKRTPDPQDVHNVAAWWSHLTTYERTNLMSTSHRTIGNLEGIPLDVRDHANRLTLKEHYDKHPPAELGLRNTVKELAARTRTIRRPDGTQTSVTAILHTFEPDTGRVAYGLTSNANDVDHTTVLIPGTGTNLENFSAQVQRTIDIDTQLRMEDGQYDRHGMTVMWLGYTPPPKIYRALALSYANRGKMRLQGVLNGFKTTSPNTRLSLLGHSYGTKVAIGTAAETSHRLHTVTLIAPTGANRKTERDAVDNTDHPIGIQMYETDFLSRKHSRTARLLSLLLNRSHGQDLTTPKAGRHIWSEVGPASLVTDANSKKVTKGVHSAYFQDPAAMKALIRNVLGPKRQQFDPAPMTHQARNLSA